MGFIENAQQALDFRAGYPLRTGQIDDLGQGFQFVELSMPIIAHAEYMHAVQLNIARFLIPGILWDDEIHASQIFNDPLPIFKADNGLLPLDAIEFVGRDSDNELVSKVSESGEQVQMADMEKIKRA